MTVMFPPPLGRFSRSEVYIPGGTSLAELDIALKNMNRIERAPLTQEVTPAVIEFRSKIMALEDKLREIPSAMDYSVTHKDPYPLVHRFADGVYAREITIPAGHVVCGEIHKYDHISIITKGRVVVYTEEGTIVHTAPSTWISPKGTKRALLTLEETVWTTFHKMEEIPLEDIRTALTVPSFEAFEALMLEEHRS